MPEIQLTAKERQALKAMAHPLKPVVLLGSAGLTPAVVKEIDRALAAHELIKIRVPGEDRDQREQLFAGLAESLSAARVQAIGKLLVLFRPRPEEPPLPKPGAERGSRPAKAAKAPARAAGRTGEAKARAKPGRSEVQRAGRGSLGATRRPALRTGAPKGGRSR